MSNMLLEAKEIHTYYGASHILHGIDFNIREGEGVALMGRALITAELASGTLVQPFGPELPGQPFHLVYPVQRAGDPLVRAVRDWLLHEPEPERRTMPHA